MMEYKPREIVKIYSRRMQIEQNFRDEKSERYGLGLRASKSWGEKRISVLCLVATLYSIIIWLTGYYLESKGMLTDKALVREIIRRKSDERSADDRKEVFLFDIVAFEADFDEEQHQVAITPCEIFSGGRSILKSDDRFEKSFESW